MKKSVRRKKKEMEVFVEEDMDMAMEKEKEKRKLLQGDMALKFLRIILLQPVQICLVIQNLRLESFL